LRAFLEHEKLSLTLKIRVELRFNAKIFFRFSSKTLIFRVKLNFSCSENARNRFFA